MPRIVERYAELCADAAQHTDAKIVYEFMPYDVNVNDVDTALEVVEGADASNGGLAIDTWHIGKLRLEPDELRRIPPRFISWVELSDGPYEYTEDRVDEVINRRRLPGEGEFPIREYVAAFRSRLPRAVGRRGALGGAPKLPIEQIFDRAYETTARSSIRHLRGARRNALTTDSTRAADWMFSRCADPRVRGAGEADVRGAPRRDPRPHASRRRGGGLDRRLIGALGRMTSSPTYRCHGYPIAREPTPRR